MSRIGNNPIEVPAGVTLTVKDREVCVKGAKGEMNLTLSPLTDAELKDKQLIISRNQETKEARSIHGTMRSLIANMIEGVSKGFKKELEINGVGFRAQLDGNTVTMLLGFSHPIVFEVPEGVQVQVPDATKIVVESCDKQKVGQVAARLRSYYPAEPYKGKGVKYKGEHIRRKAGKTVA